MVSPESHMVSPESRNLSSPISSSLICLYGFHMAVSVDQSDVLTNLHLRPRPGPKVRRCEPSLWTAAPERLKLIRSSRMRTDRSTAHARCHVRRRPGASRIGGGRWGDEARAGSSARFLAPLVRVVADAISIDKARSSKAGRCHQRHERLVCGAGLDNINSQAVVAG
jgi:hypothetical protein